LSKESRRLGDELAKLLLDIIHETRDALAQAEAPLGVAGSASGLPLRS
jgi:hypothetical protein